MAERTEDKRRLLELKLELQRREAINSFPVFLDYTQRSYSRQWFHSLVARKCQELFEGELWTKKLMIFMPPQHGKSEIISRKFPPWALGKNPDLKIVGASYSAGLALQFGRSVQRTIESPEYKSVFPDTHLSGSKASDQGRQSYSRTMDYFEIVGKAGFYKAVGVCGGLTGTAVDIGIIDDPIKDALEAASPTYRERVWSWFTDVFLTRLHNDSKIILIQTRWHEDDLAGRILKKEGDEWEVVCIPAIREDYEMADDPREIGEALWEEQHSIKKLRKAERLSPRSFSALYQQRPVVDGGNIVKRDWFQRVTQEDFSRIYTNEIITFFVDTAYTNKEDNDPTGIIATCKIGSTLYITHGAKVRMRFPDLIKFLPSYVRTHGYTVRSSVRIEPKANGLSVIDQLKEYTQLNVTQTPPPSDSKETRLVAASASVECGRVVLVEGDWTEPFIDEVCGFPAKPHDEYPDLLGYAIDYHLNSPYKPIDKERLSRAIY